MGSRPVPSYANIFMAEIDQIINSLGSKYNKENVEALRLLKRFLDDYFMLFIGSTKELHSFLDEVNKINPSIQLTMNHTSDENEDPEEICNCEDKNAVPFLDTLVSIKDGKIEVDLYKKKRDRQESIFAS